MPGINEFLQALRNLRKHPLQGVIVVMLIALGVGASSAFYSVSEAVVLRPLPYDSDNRLVGLEQRLEPPGSPLMNSHQNLNELREQSRVLESVAAFQASYGSITGQGGSKYAQGMAVDRYFLPLLNIAPAFGRGFTAADEQPGAPCTMILGHGLWRRHFASDPSILGKDILLDDKLCTVIAVMPRSFFFPFRELGVAEEDFWLPLQANLAHAADYDKYGIGRVKRGRTLQHAQVEASLLAKHMTWGDKGYETHTFVLRPYREVMVAEYLPMLRLLRGILACLLFVVCVNTAGLLSVEAMRSRKEFEIRFALGGRRYQIARVFLLRAFALAAVGGLAGIALAWEFIDLARKSLADQFPQADQIVLNASVLCFAVAVALGTGIVSGLWPAVTITQNLYKSSLSGRGYVAPSLSMQRSRSYLVGLQLAISAALLAVTGLLGISLSRLLNMDPGMQLDHRLVVILKPNGSHLKTADTLRALYSRVEQQLLTIPGIQVVALSSDVPLGAHATRDFHLKDTPPLKTSEWTAQARAVSPNYFRALGIPIRRGRSFHREDRTAGKPVAIVNEIFARRFIRNKPALGTQICVPNGKDCLWREIVGVVPDLRDTRIDTPPEPAFFLPFSQAPKEFLSDAAFTARTAIAPIEVQKAIRMSELAPGALSMVSFSLEQTLSSQTTGARARLWILGAIATLALVLAAMGVYGIIAGIIEQRRREIGIRLAIGASPQAITALFMRNMSLTLVRALLIGAFGAAVMVRSIKSFLFETSPISPGVYFGAAVVVSIVALIATLIPVRRALQRDPSEILRAE